MKKILIQTTPSQLPFPLLLKRSTSILLLLSAVICVVFSISQSVAAQSTFNNPTKIVDFTTGYGPTPASPYPSSITVSGLSGSVAKVTVTLNNVNFDSPLEIDILLVGPNGQSVVLMSDVTGAGFGSIYNATLKFDDTGISPSSDCTVGSGIYKPINCDPLDDFFPAPAPAGPYGAILSAFNGTNPNGTWSLSMIDDNDSPWDYGGNAISAGWSLTLTTSTRVLPIDDPQFFVRQHYLDFLNREPEPSGLNAWLNVLSNCSPGDSECVHQARITTSAAFFGSQEFHLKGYFVYRFFKLAFNRLPEFAEIAPDMQDVTGQTPAEVYARKAAFTNAFVQRQEFLNTYGGLSNANFVAALLARYGLESIVTPDPIDPDGLSKLTLTRGDLINGLDTTTLTRAQVLRAIADSDHVLNLEFNPAFVAMQYYGYLRRTPESTGYQAWLNYLNANPGDFRNMVRGFVDSIEYRSRFDSCEGCWDH